MEFPKITENYSQQTNLPSYTSTVKKLLKYVPQHWLDGLKEIILTDTTSLPRKSRRQKLGDKGHRAFAGKCNGYYSQGDANSPASVTLLMDNVMDLPKLLRIIPLLKYFLIGYTLYHEIGHHIHKYIKPEYKKKELVAQDYNRKLLNKMMFTRYWYFVPLFFILAMIIKGTKFFIKKFKKN